jgi:putative phage-type endonuclease
MHELEDLIDILHEITAPDEEQEDLFVCYNDDDDDKYVMDFLETAIHLMDIYVDENPTAVTEPDFEEVFKETITDLFLVQFEEMEDDVEEEIEDILKDAFDIYFSTFYQCRSLRVEDETVKDEDKDKEEEMETLAEKIQELRSLPQPTQRTKEWYHFRHNLITASNAYKAFESQATKNQLIYEKCQPIPDSNSSTEPTQMVNVNSTFHWGQKYEPLSVMMYEDLYNTKIEDFGCIQHKTHKFLGASPDGINVDSNNTELYGRMLEIKNIVNREITGIPKKEYWIQTQLQMEVCDLDECDFLETKFVEYENSIAYYNDCQDSSKSFLSQKKERKGIIMYFSTKEGRPHYAYLPLQLTNEEHITQWEENTLDNFEGLGMTWIKNCYWKLEKLSCVLITRNKKWFLDNIGAIADVWSIIERERITGYEHRAPVKRVKKESSSSSSSSFVGCYLKITKENHDI